MKKIHKIVLMVVAIIVISYMTLVSLSRPPLEVDETQVPARICIQSGGNVTTGLCCKDIGHFPNLCSIGACGCSPDNSYEIEICDCGPDKCFDGLNGCVSKPLQ